MKKEYIKPELEAHEIETLNLICDSPGIGPGKAGGGGVLSKEREEMEDAVDDLMSW